MKHNSLLFNHRFGPVGLFEFSVSDLRRGVRLCEFKRLFPDSLSFLSGLTNLPIFMLSSVVDGFWSTTLGRGVLLEELNVPPLS